MPAIPPTDKSGVSLRGKDEKNTVAITDGTPGNPNQVIISESGLYRLVLTSRKPQAEAFQDWVVQEVLPTIRKTGSYSIKQPTIAEMLLQSAQLLVEHEQKLNQVTQEVNNQNERLEVIEERFESAVETLKQLPPATEDVPTKSVRSCLNEVLRSYSYRTGEQHQNLWNALYKEYRYRHHVDIKKRAKNEHLKVLDYADQFGVIDKLYALALELYGQD